MWNLSFSDAASGERPSTLLSNGREPGAMLKWRVTQNVKTPTPTVTGVLRRDHDVCGFSRHIRADGAGHHRQDDKNH